MTTDRSVPVWIALTDTPPPASRRGSLWALLRPHVDQLQLAGTRSAWLTMRPLSRTDINTVRVLLVRYARECQPAEQTWRFQTRYDAATRTLAICKVCTRST